MRNRITALILAAIFAVPLCCCWGKGLQNVDKGEVQSTFIASCPHCPTVPSGRHGTPESPNESQSCDCADKQLASEDGVLATPKADAVDLINPPASVAEALPLVGHASPLLTGAEQIRVLPPGVPARLVYCVHRL